MITCIFEKGAKTSLRHVVVHAIVVRENEILLERRNVGLEKGKWALPGGFLDRDETAAQAVLRELFEETGWEGEIISLFRINTNPNRPHEDRQNVALDFIVRPVKREDKTSEISDLRWFTLDNLPPVDEIAFDHGESIKMYLKYRKFPFPLPVYF